MINAFPSMPLRGTRDTCIDFRVCIVHLCALLAGRRRNGGSHVRPRCQNLFHDGEERLRERTTSEAGAKHRARRPKAEGVPTPISSKAASDVRNRPTTQPARRPRRIQ
jgi:hypothetical protein